MGRAGTHSFFAGSDVSTSFFSRRSMNGLRISCSCIAMKPALAAVSAPRPFADSKSNRFLKRSTSVKISGRTKERSEKSSTRLFYRAASVSRPVAGLPALRRTWSGVPVKRRRCSEVNIFSSRIRLQRDASALDQASELAVRTDCPCS